MDLTSGHGEVFTEDVLKIEVHGPNEDYLTVIDVPGIFRTCGEGTTKEDMQMVKDLVTSYIKEPRTIILAVLPANVDMLTQEILQLAEEYDPDGQRTIGVLTKPDLVTESSAQRAVCDLVAGKRKALNLGYFLVQNRGPDVKSNDASDLERIFRLAPWNVLPPDRMGILALKEQLAALLLEMSSREFPALVLDVNNQIKRCKVDLDGLGPPRQDEHEQRSFLHRIAESFQDRVRAALNADYNAAKDFSQKNVLRLMTHVVNVTEIFRADFEESAHSRHFGTMTKDLCAPTLFDKADTTSLARLRVLVEEIKVDDITETEKVELGDILNRSDRTFKQDGYVADWISDAFLRSRGLEMGTFNSNFIAEAFVEQTQNWEAMTAAYMRRIIVAVHRFIAAALRSVWADDIGRRQLWSHILESLVSRYRVAIAQAQLLLQVEQQKQPYTINPHFSKSHSRARGERLAKLLRPSAREDSKSFGAPQYIVNLKDIPSAGEQKSKMEDAKERIHDILQAYYCLALDRFLDNVFQLAVDHLLLRGPDGPLRVFTQDWVIKLPADVLKRIVGETKAARKHRNKLGKKMEDLTAALQVLNEL